MLGRRTAPKHDETRYETHYAFRPLGNPLMIYTGSGSFTGGQFKVSVMIPTPLGGVTIRRQSKEQSSVRYLMLEYKGTHRVFSIRDGFEFNIEDPKMYSVSTLVRGDFIILKVTLQTDVE